MTKRKRPRPEGDGGRASRGQGAERNGNVELNPPRSALLCRPYVGPNGSLVARPPSADLIIYAKDLFIAAMMDGSALRADGLIGDEADRFDATKAGITVR